MSTPIDERYLKDQVFAQFVDLIYYAAQRGDFTPTEIREAALYAQMKYEMQHPRPIVLSDGLKKWLKESGNAVHELFRPEHLK